MDIKIIIFLFVSIVCFSRCNSRTEENPKPSLFYDTDPVTEQKVSGLLKKMTLEEKAMQLASHFPNGNVRLGIPHMQAGECLHGVVAPEATTFPQAIALGCTWDPGLVEKASTLIAREARALGIHHCYTPMLGLARDARWGRMDESYGEDPFLVSRIGVAFINGLQGKGDKRFDSNHIMATAKHYVADGEPVAGDNGAAVEISLRSLHEVHLPPFRAAVEEAGVGAIMPAHHSLNGLPCHINDYILKDVLHNKYGFNGCIVSDNNDIKKAFSVFKVSDNVENVIHKSLELGVNLELAWMAAWGQSRVYGPPLIKAVKEGKIPVSLLDRAVSKTLEYKYKLGLFEDETAMDPENDLFEVAKTTGKEVTYAETKRAYTKPRRDYKNVLYDPASDSLALKVAEKAIILLKNENGLLPLEKSKVRHIAVIGPNADRMVLGGYSTREPRYFVTVLDGIKNIIPEGTNVMYAQGVDMHDPSLNGINEAVSIAKKADVVVLVVGGDNITMKENQDRDDITLAGPQEPLIKAVTAAGKPVVMVLIHGRPLAIEWEKENIDAILDCWYLGQETGNAVARTIFGNNNPGGKLSVTYPRNTGQIPEYYNKLPTARPRNIYNSTPGPLFPFGYGLSYTKFEITDFKMSDSLMSVNDTVWAIVTIKNTGERTGDEVLQMYIRDEVCSLVRPALELKGFERITLEKGEAAIVNLSVSRSSLEFRKGDKWIVEPGEFKVMIGTNSIDLQSLSLILE